MNATEAAAKYTAQAMHCYIRYAETQDPRDAAMYKDRARHYEVLAESARESAQRDAAQIETAAPVPTQPVAVQAPKVEAAKPDKVRCPHRKLIARFFAIARENGLDTSKAAKPQMRHAMESAMKRCVNSRSEVSAQEWLMLGDWIKAGRLAW